MLYSVSYRRLALISPPFSKSDRCKVLIEDIGSSVLVWFNYTKFELNITLIRHSFAQKTKQKQKKKRNNKEMEATKESHREGRCSSSVKEACFISISLCRKGL